MRHALPLLATSLALAAASASAQDVIRVAGNFAVEHSSSVALEVFKERLEEASGGEIEVNLFPARQLGGAAENRWNGVMADGSTRPRIYASIRAASGQSASTATMSKSCSTSSRSVIAARAR